MTLLTSWNTTRTTLKNPPRVTGKFNKVPRYKVHIQKTIAFLYNNNKHMENEIKI